MMEDGLVLHHEVRTAVRTNGFMEVYHSGTEEVELLKGHSFSVATLPAIVLLKFIAFDDRPERRFKDARDIANIISHYFDLQTDIVYDHHSDLFSDSEKTTITEIAAIVIGREMYRILQTNTQLYQRLKNILTGHIAKFEHSSFLRNMVLETGTTITLMARYLECILQGLTKAAGGV